MVIPSIGAKGGAGGYGGAGGDACKGGNGGTDTPGFVSTIISGGGDGGDGATGGAGGHGGNAAGAIFNTGELTLRDVAFRNVGATGGDGGAGATAGRGGHGGEWGGVPSLPGPTENLGGDGGNGADGGRGGSGGTAAAAVWSIGTVAFDGPQPTPVFSQIFGGTGGQGGNAGTRGGGGNGFDYIPHGPMDGNDGLPGNAGTPGANGQTGAFVGVNPATTTVFSLSHDGAAAVASGDLSERAVRLTLHKMGLAAGSVSGGLLGKQASRRQILRAAFFPAAQSISVRMERRLLSIFLSQRAAFRTAPGT